jgi:hypothetical protein
MPRATARGLPPASVHRGRDESGIWHIKTVTYKTVTYKTVTYKTANIGFRPWLPGKNISNVLSGCLFARKRKKTTRPVECHGQRPEASHQRLSIWYKTVTNKTVTYKTVTYQTVKD